MKTKTVKPYCMQHEDCTREDSEGNHRLGEECLRERSEKGRGGRYEGTYVFIMTDGFHWIGRVIRDADTSHSVNAVIRLSPAAMVSNAGTMANFFAGKITMVEEIPAEWVDIPITAKTAIMPWSNPMPKTKI